MMGILDVIVDTLYNVRTMLPVKRKHETDGVFFAGSLVLISRPTMKFLEVLYKFLFLKPVELLKKSNCHYSYRECSAVARLYHSLHYPLYENKKCHLCFKNSIVESYLFLINGNRS